MADRYGLNSEKFVRPFVPNGDYQSFDYAPDVIVVDNPPFSILSEIQRFYAQHNIKFFLFAPALTIFRPLFADAGICAICTGAAITYDNGAAVSTSFVTNLEPDGHIAISAPGLYQAIKRADEIQRKKNKKQLPKYVYPDNVLTATMVNYLSAHGVEYAVRSKDACFVRALEDQKKHKKGIYGSGFLLSDKSKNAKVKAEKAAKEKAAKEKETTEAEDTQQWQLSDRELEIIRGLG